MALEQERRTFQALKAELLEHHEGEYALIIGDELIDTFDNDLDAYLTGVARVGNAPMLIQRIEREERVESLPALTLGILRADH